MTVRFPLFVAAVLLVNSSAVACPPAAARRTPAPKPAATHGVRIVVLSQADCNQRPISTMPAPISETPASGAPDPDDLPPDTDVLPEPALDEPSSPTGDRAPVAPAAPTNQPAPTEAPEVTEGDILTLRSQRVGSIPVRVWLAAAGATVECKVLEREAGRLRFEIPVVATHTGPAIVVVTDGEDRVLRRLRVTLRVEDEQLDVERVVTNP